MRTTSTVHCLPVSAKHSRILQALREESEALERPELERIAHLMRHYRQNFHNALAYYRNTYLEHRESNADRRMLESFHRLDAAEDTFEKVWRAIEAIVAGIVVANLPHGLVLVETPEVNRDTSRPERFRLSFSDDAG